MGGTTPSTSEDPTHVRFRLRNVQAGVGISIVGAVGYIAYQLMTWDRPHRVTMCALAVGAILFSLLLTRLDLEPIMRRRGRREAFFLAWSAATVAIVALGPLTDGGVSSPETAGFFLPLAFAALSYPLVSTLAVGAMVVGAYVAVAVALGGEPASEVYFISMALTCATWLCAWQARNHDRQRLELGRVSRSDPLTGCLNRRGFEERFAAEIARARRTRAPLSMLLLDLDDFKRTNDERGHAAGDELLRWVVATIAAVVRPTDAVGRLGGDEFAILAPGAARAEATRLGERLQAALQAKAPTSFGIASFPHDGGDLDALHHHADLSLYEVKHGRIGPAPAVANGELSWAAALVRAVDERMATAHEHSSAVAGYAAAIGTVLGWEEDRLAPLRLAAMLHDVGKIAIPEVILRKPGRLTDDEMALVRTHAAVGAGIVAQIEGVPAITPWIRHAHEHVDGSGYPDGLSGESIPLESRILLVADAFDAMTSDRSYREAMAVADALAELRRYAGVQFDERCIEALAQALRAERAEALDDVVDLA
jgi:diguanylate cyclase (GGDEF)-like protein